MVRLWNAGAEKIFGLRAGRDGAQVDGPDHS
jgi:hypothetical protein